MGTSPSAVARQFVSPAVGILPHLLRVRRREDRRRRPAMAQLHRNGRVLPERPASDVDRLVGAPPPPLVSRRDGIRSARTGDGSRLDHVFPPPLSTPPVLHRHALANRHHPHCQLYVPEFPCPRPRFPSSRRPFPRAAIAAALERIFCPPISCGATRERDPHGKLARSPPAAPPRPQTHSDRRNARLALLRIHCAAPLDDQTGNPFPDHTRGGARTVPYRRSLWPFRWNDPRPLRDCSPGLRRWSNFVDLSFS